MQPHQSALTELFTLRDFIRFGASEFSRAELFYGHGLDNPFDEAEQLVLHALCLEPPLADEWLDARLTQNEKRDILALFTQRIEARVPVAYLTGCAWFVGLPFKVDERVLVPRSPIGELIDNHFAPWLQQAPRQILDLCTGSGCIGIACAYAFPEACVQLSDISYDALEVAEENIANHGLSDRVFSLQSDLFENLTGQKFDLIVSNPPYVDAEDMADLPPEYHAEPELALASGADGLDFTRRLLREACAYLNEDGLLVVEVGNSWPALADAFPKVPFNWLEFSRGGHGVFTLDASTLREAVDNGWV